MNFPLVCLLATIMSVPFGAAFLLAPEVMTGQYGVAGWNPGTLQIVRLFGATLLFVGGAAMAVRRTTDTEVKRGISTWFALASAITTAVTIHAAATGAVNAMGWVSTATYAFFTAAWASVAFGKTPRSL